VAELELLKEILRLCETYGLRAHHCHDSRKCHGRGFPDIIIVGKQRVLFAELKVTGNRSTSQCEWGWSLIAAGADYVVWHPIDLLSGKIEAELSIL
jgi:hypothetical protein